MRRGHQIIRSHWLEKIIKELSLPDIGIQVDWETMVEQR